MEVAMRRERCGIDTSEVSLSTSTVFARIAVELLMPHSRPWNPDTIILAHHGGKVAHYQHRRAGAVLAQERQDARLRIAVVHPLEALGREVELEQGRSPPVETVQVANPSLRPRVQRVLQDVPFQTLLVLPLAALPEFRPHEEQLLAGMSPHVAVQQAQIRELLPFVAGHLAANRPLAVDHLVM